MEEPKVVLVDGLQVHLHSAPVGHDNLIYFVAELHEIRVVLVDVVQESMRFGICRDFYINSILIFLKEPHLPPPDIIYSSRGIS